MTTQRDPVAHIRHLPVREQIKYCAARYADKHREEDCPREFSDVKGTWSQWFKRLFKQSLDSYIRERKERSSGVSDVSSQATKGDIRLDALALYPSSPGLSHVDARQVAP